MNKLVWALVFSLISLNTWACPNCYSYDPNKPPYTLIIVGIFILITYIPFYLLFRAMKKYDPAQQSDLDKTQ